MNNSTYYQKNRDIILKRAKDYYYNNIEAVRKNMRETNIKIFQKREKMKNYQKIYREKMKNNISEEKRKKMRKY